MNTLIIVSIAAAFAVSTLPTQAQNQAPSLNAHVHGVSELTIAAEGESLEIQLISPAMNLVGFEHKATSLKDIAAVEKLTKTLQQHNALFVLPNADCQHIKTSLDLSSIMDTHHTSHDHQSDPHQSEMHDEQHKHDHEEHNHQNQNHDQEHDQNKNHQEVIANYQYRCKTSAPLSSITLALFNVFPGIHKIQAMWIKQTQQGAATLIPDNRTIVFR
jgi:hypothetical protein